MASTYQITVSPNGSLNSFAAAVAEARAHKGEAVEVRFAPGVYPLKEPVVFTSADSRAKDAPLTFRAEQPGAVVFDGGLRVNGIVVQPNGFWTAKLPCGAVEQLYVDGRLATRVRFPKEKPCHEYFYMLNNGGYTTDSDGNAVDLRRSAFYAEPDDLAVLKGLSQKELQQVVVVAYHSWESGRLHVKSVDFETGLVMLEGATCWPFLHWGARQRYHLENMPTLQMAPGEWFVAADGTLTYAPLPGETPDSTVLSVPVTPSFLQFKGEAASPIANIHFDGLTFRNAAYVLPLKGHNAGQAEVDMEAVIQGDFIEDCSFDRCEIGSIGIMGFWWRLGCHRIAMTHCHIHDLGGGGVKIGTSVIPEDRSQVTDFVTVHNCIIAHGGRLHHGAHGIWIGHASDNTLTHNEIGDFFYTGIAMGWTWGYRDTVTHRNHIDYNHIHDIGQGVLSDMGGVYTLGRSDGTTVSHNHIHHVYSYDYYGAGGWGLYTDEGSAEIEEAFNLVHHVKLGCIHQHYGRDNNFHNNILAFSLNNQIVRSRIEDHRSFFLHHNIIYWDNDSPLFNKAIDDQNVDVHHNLYWNTKVPMTFNGKTLQEWQATGHGEGDVVEDPLFVDAEHGDFHFKPGSPYKKIDFIPFDYTEAGVLRDNDAAWGALADAVAAAPFEFTPPPSARNIVIDDDFEKLPVGAQPVWGVVSLENKGDSIAVTDETACTGRHCLKFKDVKGLTMRFNPYLYLGPSASSGKAFLSFDFKSGKNIEFYIEFRDGMTPGPSVYFFEDKLCYRDNSDKMNLLTPIPLAQWFHVDMVLTLGQPGAPMAMTVALPDQQPQTFSVPMFTSSWHCFNWLGFVANADADAVCYLDNVKYHAE